MDPLDEGANKGKRKTTRESEAKFRSSQFEASSGTSINESVFISANNFVSRAERNCLWCSLRFASGLPTILESAGNGSMDDNGINSRTKSFHSAPVMNSERASRPVNYLFSIYHSLQKLLLPCPFVPRGSGIYRQCLTETGRGIPIWLPGPSSTLPDAYRRRGVAVGDVGILMESGGFDFFFNIYLPENHTINQQGVPAGFSPLPKLQPSDIYRNSEFGPNSFFVSTSVDASYGDNDCSGITFKSSASEGAILIMPQGGYSEDLLNVSSLRRYVLANAESWYIHVNGTRGREARNGDLVLVKGCDKAPSWAMAAFTKSTAYDFRLKFKPTDETGSRRTYGWEYSGSVELKVGPLPEETEELTRDDCGQPVVYTNQTLFMRTIPVKIRDDIWNGLGFDFETAMDV